MPTMNTNFKCITREMLKKIYNAHGCKHNKVDQRSAPKYEVHSFFSQTHKRSSKMLFKLLIKIHANLFCCVKCSSVKKQDEIFKTYDHEK